MPKAWVLVANRQQARILAENGHELIEQEVIQNAEAAKYEREMGSDRPGRVSNAERRARHALESEETPMARALHDFARQIGRRLKLACHHNEFEQLTLVADPGMLGAIRSELPEHCLNKVRESWNKDLVKLSPRELGTEIRRLRLEKFSEPPRTGL